LRTKKRHFESAEKLFHENYDFAEAFSTAKLPWHNSRERISMPLMRPEHKTHQKISHQVPCLSLPANICDVFVFLFSTLRHAPVS
jgi:hypothetical protein